MVACLSNYLPRVTQFLDIAHSPVRRSRGQGSLRDCGRLGLRGSGHAQYPHIIEHEGSPIIRLLPQKADRGSRQSPARGNRGGARSSFRGQRRVQIAEFAASRSAAAIKAVGQTFRPLKKSSNRVSSPRLSFEMSPSARTSKGFLISQTRVASSRRQFKQTAVAGEFLLDGDVSPLCDGVSASSNSRLSCTAVERSTGPTRTSSLDSPGCKIRSEVGGIRRSPRRITTPEIPSANGCERPPRH